MPGEPEAQGALGRVYKDMWRTTWSQAAKLEERTKLAWRNIAMARRSIETYEVANSTFHKIAAAATASVIAAATMAARFITRPPPVRGVECRHHRAA
jgi:hypothetical protein